LTFYKQWPISHNTGIGEKQKSRVLCTLRSVIDYYNKRGVLLDISKAFDKVNHYCIFIKLMNLNVPVVLPKIN